jgi:hypothetical protein
MRGIEFWLMVGGWCLGGWEAHRLRLKAVAGKRQRRKELRHSSDGLATVSEMDHGPAEATEKLPVILWLVANCAGGDIRGFAR